MSIGQPTLFSGFLQETVVSARRLAGNRRLRRPPTPGRRTRSPPLFLASQLRSVRRASATGHARGADRPFPSATPSRFAVTSARFWRSPTTSSSSIGSFKVNSSLASLCRFRCVIPKSPGSVMARLRIDASVGAVRADLCCRRLVIITKCLPLAIGAARQLNLELRCPAMPSPAEPISIITQVDASGVVGASPPRSIENEEPFTGKDQSAAKARPTARRAQPGPRMGATLVDRALQHDNPIRQRPGGVRLQALDHDHAAHAHRMAA